MQLTICRHKDTVRQNINWHAFPQRLRIIALGTSHQWSNTVAIETVSIRRVKFFSHIYYYHQDLYHRQFLSCSRRRFSTTCASSYHHDRHRDSTAPSYACSPSIFKTSSFGRYVVTHFLADFDFHDHRPAVFMSSCFLNISVVLGTFLWIRD